MWWGGTGLWYRGCNFPVAFLAIFLPGDGGAVFSDTHDSIHVYCPGGYNFDCN